MRCQRVVRAIAITLIASSFFVYGQTETAVYRRHFAEAKALVASKGADYYLEPKSRAHADTPHNLADAVVRIDARQLLLAPVFARVAPGKYRLEFKPVASRDLTSSDVITVYFEWDNTRQTAESPPALVPGLYKVNLFFATSTTGLPVGDRAWILIADAARYEGLRAEVEQARNQIQDPILLRAFLDAIK